MGFSMGSIKLNIMVTVLTAIMVFVLPWLDHFICRKLKVSLNDSLSANPNADKILHARKYLLIVMVVVYLLAVAYVTFFSRGAYDDYKLHIALFEDLGNSIKIDFGILGFIKAIFTDGISRAMSHVKIQHFEDIAQVYLNVILFIPLGYLLPYVFDWFRADILKRTVTVGFITSLFIENIQLITKRGFYDIDDLVSNTLGALLGRLFYRAVAYVLAHPDWRKNLKDYRKWKNVSKDRALYPFRNKIHLVRTTILGSTSSDIFDFYANKLGFRLRMTLDDKVNNTVYYLFEFGKTQIEIRCIKSLTSIPLQELTIACNNSERLKKRLNSHGIKTTEYKADPFTGLRTFSFNAPDGVVITIIEE